MDKFVQPYDKECMKIAMLKHEETFKEQVYELHRLYQIQKMLMKNMQKTRHNHPENLRFNNQQQKNTLYDLEQPASKDSGHVTDTLIGDQEDECEIELTLAPTSFNRRRRSPTTNNNKPESSDSVPSFSSSSSGSNHIKRIERSTRENSSFLSRNTTSSSSDRSHKQPPWMYQVLSLNMT